MGACSEICNPKVCIMSGFYIYSLIYKTLVLSLPLTVLRILVKVIPGLLGIMW